MKRIAPIFILITGFCINLFAQDETGLRMGNYSGVNGLMLNPAQSNSSFLSWDLNIMAGGFFVYEGYNYVENTNLFHFLLNRDNLTYRGTDPEAAGIDPAKALYFDSFNPIFDFDVSANAFITGPSLSLRFKKFATGIYINNRFAFGGNNIDRNLSEPSLANWNPLEAKTFDAMDAAGMAWTEIGLNFSTNIVKNRSKIISIGINLKYNLGYDGFYVKNHESGSAVAINDSLQIATGGPAEYGLATGLSGDNSNYDLGINGKGFGVDLGMTLILRSSDSRPYKMKFGAAILDLGYVHFNKNAQYHYFPASSGLEIDYLDLLETLTIDALVSKSSEQVFGDPTASRAGSEFNILTPLALNLSLDYAITKYWYWGSQITRRMDVSSRVIERENIMMSSLRYENQSFEMGLNLTIYNDFYPRMGTWFRIGPVTLGSDNIGSLVLKQDQFTGSDFYFAIKVNNYKRKYRENDPLENCNF